MNVLLTVYWCTHTHAQTNPLEKKKEEWDTNLGTHVHYGRRLPLCKFEKHREKADDSFQVAKYTVFKKCCKLHGKAFERIWIFRFFEGRSLWNLMRNPFCFLFQSLCDKINEKEENISLTGRYNWLEPNKEPMNPKISQADGVWKSIAPPNWATFENRFELRQYMQLESDLHWKVKVQAKLNFTECLSHPLCPLISSAISFSFSCLLFSRQPTVLQVNVLSYPLFHSNFS